MKKVNVIWFSGRSTVGIVRVENYNEVKYYIGAPPVSMDEQTEMNWIADWGSKFPIEIGKQLFGDE